MDRVSVASEATMEVRISRGAELNMENISVRSEAHYELKRTCISVWIGYPFSVFQSLAQTKFCVGPPLIRPIYFVRQLSSCWRLVSGQLAVHRHAKP